MEKEQNEEVEIDLDEIYTLHKEKIIKINVNLRDQQNKKKNKGN